MTVLKSVRYIFVHTAADARENGRRDTTAADIQRWHVARGWSKIGYHYVVRRDGTIENGRPETEHGAHVRGLNHCSLGICLSGHHDTAPMTSKQKEALLDLLVRLCQKYGVPPSAVLGHREVNLLANAGVIDKIYATSKSCPGRYVDMRELREALKQRINGDNTHAK